MGDNSGRFHTADADSGIRTHRFAITGAELSPGGSNIVIHWPTLPRQVYDVLWSTNATGPFLPPGSNSPKHKPTIPKRPRHESDFTGSM